MLEAQADLRSYGAKMLDGVQNALRTAEAATDSTQVAYATTSYADAQAQINSLKQQLKEVKDQNKVLLQTIATIAGNKENMRLTSNEPRQHAPWKHCWSHGANKMCDSKSYRRRKPGHNKDATFKDAKGGKKYCFHFPSAQALLPKS